MTNRIIYGAEVIGSEKVMTIWQQDQFYEELFATFPEKTAVRVIVEKHVKGRSLKQLRYYRAVFLPHAQEAWKRAGYRYSIEQIDGLMKAEFFHEEFINEHTGETHKIPWSMADGGGVTTEQFNEKKDLAQQWYVEELGYIIPDPNEQAEIELP